MTKTCKTCGILQPMDRFPRHVNMRDGHINKCRSCIAVYVRAQREKNPEKSREYHREYKRNNPERIRAANAKPKALASAYRSKIEWVRRNPQKRKAQQAITRGVRRGTILRQPCEICVADRAQAHHDDYSKPLDVRWLCTTHHAEWHKNNDAKCPDQEAAA